MSQSSVGEEAVRSAESFSGLMGSPNAFPVLYRRWLAIRKPIGLASCVSGLLAGFLLDWPEAYGVAALGAILLIEVSLTRRAGRAAALRSLHLDATLLGLAVLITRTPQAVIAIPFAYLIATSFLLLDFKWAFLPVSYATVWMSVLLFGSNQWWEPATGARGAVAGASVGLMFLGAIVVMFGQTSRTINRIKASLGRKVRYEEAIAGASRAFATGDDETAIAEALRHLLRGTEAGAVFVERNVDHPEKGLCTSLIAEELADGIEADPAEKWHLVPWSELPASFGPLAQGKPVMLDIESLPEIERRHYEGSNVRSELDIPIVVRGSWVGIIGFNDIRTDHSWSDSDIELLTTASELIGAYWERLDGRRHLEDAVERLELRHRLEHALARMSSLLLGGEDSAVDLGLQALLEATEAEFVYVDENYLDEDDELCMRIKYSAGDPKSQYLDSTHEWWGGPYSELPTSYAALSRNEPSVIYTTELEEGPELDLYLAGGLLSELCLPIHVRGEWRGSIAFVHYLRERTWTPEDIRFLRTSAALIGAFWERQGVVDSLNARVALEEALAKVSAELLTESPGALDRALGHLVEAGGADLAWLERNYVDDLGRLSAALLHKAASNQRSASEGAQPWMEGPWDETPTSFAALRAGRPSFIRTRDLVGEERRLYEDDGLRSELLLPVFVSGEWYGALGFADYIDERAWSRDDVRLIRTAAELIGSYLERRASRERLEELVNSKDEFIASISHEIRTPLTSVLGFTGVLHDEFSLMSDDDRIELLSVINREAQEVAWIIDDLLVYARSDIGTLTVTSVITPLEDQIDAVLVGQPGEISSRVSLHGSGVEAVADPGRVRQVLRNLITNAHKYGGSDIRVEVTNSGDQSLIRVSDDGPGIDGSVADRIFEAYYRAHEKGGQPGSMGLGLNVSKKLAVLMGGDLSYSREEGRTVFTFSLPAVDQPVPATT